MNERTRVLIVDDSPSMRAMLSRLLASDPLIEVIGTAPEPHAAREMIKALNPDVVTLDIEMPGMDGLSFLEKIMRLRPMPVVMCST
ncbi:MAG TPA: response regulator, partial [Sphingomonas sp.]|nr:response regulator [Sphingomonas sp.]